MDAEIVYAIQRLVGVLPAIDAAGIFCASFLIWIEGGLVGIFWLAARRRRLVAFVSASASALIALLFSVGIGAIWFRPRPFADLQGVKLLIMKSPLDKSFPSDHATIAFALATSVYLVDRRWGIAMFAMAAFIAFGRIFVGVHYLSDVVSGAVLGVAVAVTVHFLIHKILHTAHRRRVAEIKH